MYFLHHIALALQLSRHRPQDVRVIIASKPASLVDLHYNKPFDKECALCDKTAIQLEVSPTGVTGFCYQHRRSWHHEEPK